MPRVNGKKFPYTPAGKAAAAKERAPAMKKPVMNGKLPKSRVKGPRI